MAFGDIIQQAQGGSGDSVTLASAVTEGNTLLFFGRFRIYEGGKPTSISDDVNAGNYAEAFDTNVYLQDNPDVLLAYLAGSSAGSPVITTAGSLAVNWVLVEVEGELSGDVLDKAAVDHGGASDTIATASGTVKAGSVSFGASINPTVGTTFTPTNPAWSEISDNGSMEVFRRADATATTDSLSGALTATGDWAAGWASFVASGPSVSLTSGNLQPGGNFTLSYSNFAGVPTSPITLTDSNDNSITVAVTIDDNGDGTGTATGTMPALPTGASTVNGLLFGDVEVELTV